MMSVESHMDRLYLIRNWKTGLNESKRGIDASTEFEPRYEYVCFECGHRLTGGVNRSHFLGFL